MLTLYCHHTHPCTYIMSRHLCILYSTFGSRIAVLAGSSSDGSQQPRTHDIDAHCILTVYRCCTYLEVPLSIDLFENHNSIRPPFPTAFALCARASFCTVQYMANPCVAAIAKNHH